MKKWRQLKAISELEEGALVRFKDGNGEAFEVTETTPSASAKVKRELTVSNPPEWEVLLEEELPGITVNGFLQELRGSLIPARAKWVAQDADGAWWWYENKPECRKRAWCYSKECEGDGWGRITVSGRPEDFTTTLRKLEGISLPEMGQG